MVGSSKITLAVLLFIGGSLNAVVKAQCLSENDDAGTDGKTSAKLMAGASISYATEQFNSLMQSKVGENIFISPYSIWSSLLLTYLGANGRTAEELGKVLAVGDVDRAVVGRGFLKLNDNLQKMQKDSRSVLSVANKIVFDDSIKFRECMVDKFYNELARVNFTLQPEDSRDRINAWVAQRTKNIIKELIPKGGVSSQTKMVIVNAVYFKGEWYHTFDKSATVKDSFLASDGQFRKVDMMKLKANIFYNESPELGVKMVELPYADGDFSMVIMLPDLSTSVEEVASKLTDRTIKDSIQQMISARVTLKMPKFKLDDGYDLVETLQRLGVNRLFSNADLTGYTNDKISVSSVIHKAFVDVDEKGSTAAGATAVISSRTSRVLSDRTLEVNRPFLFFIKDNSEDVILFMGAVNKPDGEIIRNGLSFK